LPFSVSNVFDRFVEGKVVVVLSEWLYGVCDESLKCGHQGFANEWHMRTNHMPSLIIHGKDDDDGDASRRAAEWVEMGVFDFILGSWDRCRVTTAGLTTAQWFRKEIGYNVVDQRMCQNVHTVQVTDSLPFARTLVFLDSDKSWAMVKDPSEEESMHAHRVLLRHGCSYPADLARLLLDTNPPTPLQQIYQRNNAGKKLSKRVDEELSRMQMWWWGGGRDNNRDSGNRGTLGLRLSRIFDAQTAKLLDHLKGCIRKLGVHRAVCVGPSWARSIHATPQIWPRKDVSSKLDANHKR
jgi:hypothetical protein